MSVRENPVGNGSRRVPEINHLQTRQIVLEKSCIREHSVVLLAWRISAMEVALYARVSTRDKGQDVRNQLEELR
ncbi:MAG TPA: hypothetical protein VF783_05640, partial [Terriglobales bacterium]